jgi:thiol-disulfide isomerase/thioredoxin
MNLNMIKNLIIGLSLVIMILPGCNTEYTSEKYLAKVDERLGEIRSASYYLTSENWNPGDTAASSVFTTFVKEYDNPADTTIGASFVVLDSLTRSGAEFCYDGQMRALFYNDVKGIVIDSFRVRQLPFRPLSPPFYNFVTNIIKYALTTGDSISLEMEEQDSSVFVRMTIFEAEQVEFFGKAFHMPITPYTYDDNTSIYELWIDKGTDLPYKVRREMSHNISVEICISPEYNNLDINDFVASDYFPPDYEIRQYGDRSGPAEKKPLIDMKAPDWTLLSPGNQEVALSDLKSKVLMIQFTSISCGPCRASVPFLKALQKEYDPGDFDFVAIECTSKNMNALISYMKHNQFDYKFLQADNEVIENYSVSSFPVFYLLDGERVVREVIRGYAESVTDETIRSAVNRLLDNDPLGD